MRRMPTFVDDALVALLLTAVVVGQLTYFAVEGLPSFLWRV